MDVGINGIRRRAEGIGVTALAGIGGTGKLIFNGVKRLFAKRSSNTFVDEVDREAQRKWLLEVIESSNLHPPELAVEDLSSRRHWHHHPKDVIRMVRDCIAVVGDKLDWRGAVTKLARGAMSSRKCYKTSKKIYKRAKELFEGSKKELKAQIAIERGKHMPAIENIYEHGKEEVTNGDLSLAGEYLRAIGLESQAAYVESLGPTGSRPSELKKGVQVQGATINLRRHAFFSTEENEEHVIIRSGGFVVHDGDERRVLLAQALPKLALTLREILKRPASMAIVEKTGRFLYAEQCLMSHANGKEWKMIKDMQEAMREVGERVQVRLGETDGIELEGNRVILCLQAEEALHGKEFAVESLFFTQGINTLQSMGQAFKSYLPLQDEINRQGLEGVFRYAKEAGADTDPAVEDLKEHYAKNQAPRDREGIEELSWAVGNLGGILNYCCKSGKDRTGMVVSDDFANRFGEEWLPELQIGASRKIAGQNVSLHRKDLYALNMYQVLPGDLGPASTARVLIKND